MRKRFTCSYNRIELVITYACNMRCLNCDAMVSQAPSNESMSVEQIKKFIKESIEKKVFWKHIRILGGEPSLHKDIQTILRLLIDFKKEYSPETKIQLVTNGHGEAVKKSLSLMPEGIEIENSAKTSNIQPSFSPVNQAPIDMEEYAHSDFSKGCWIPSLCGITLDHHGYYPCSASAAMDRVFGFDLAQKELPTEKGILEKNFSTFCKHCGHFYDKINEAAQEDILNEKSAEAFEKIHETQFPITLRSNDLREQIFSPTWKQAIEKYKKKKPRLSSY